MDSVTSAKPKLTALVLPRPVVYQLVAFRIMARRGVVDWIRCPSLITGEGDNDCLVDAQQGKRTRGVRAKPFPQGRGTK